jgi:uncharacterized protein
MELKVQLPSDKPLASVSILPKSGWSYLVTKSKLATPIKSDDGDITEAISTIDWKADSAASAIKPGEFDQFVISAGPLPTASSITFKVLQTYSDGSVVSWIEQAAPGSSAEPQHPAPTLTLAPAGTDASASGHSASSSADGDHTEATIATVLGGVGVLLGAAALGVVLIRTRRTS